MPITMITMNTRPAQFFRLSKPITETDVEAETIKKARNISLIFGNVIFIISGASCENYGSFIESWIFSIGT